MLTGFQTPVLELKAAIASTAFEEVDGVTSGTFSPGICFDLPEQRLVSELQARAPS